MVLNMSLLMSQHVFCWTQWGSDRLPSSSCARFRVLYEDCSKTLRKETFFKPPGAHHQTNSMEFHPPNAPSTFCGWRYSEKARPKHVPRFEPVRWTSNSGKWTLSAYNSDTIRMTLERYCVLEYLQMISTKMPVYCTLPKFNMEPENDGFHLESPFPWADFQVPCLTSGV